MSTMVQHDHLGLRASRQKLIARAEIYHDRLPIIRRLPLPTIGIISLILFVNIVVWVATGIVLAHNARLAGTAAIAYSLGLRHAVDADHISAIDLMTRRLIAAGQTPVTCGTFFSLGHSLIVVVTSIVVAATAAAFQERFDCLSQVGGIIGTSVSAAFLIILSMMNIYILYALVKQITQLIDHGPTVEHDPWPGGGCLFRVFKKLFVLIDRPWKMFPLGVLFGLGFDTSSEIALLGIASIQAAEGTGIWLILIFPILFTAGMCLIDTIDGALMVTLYTSPTFARDQIAVLYYSIVLTVVTVIASMTIGVIQVLTLVLNVANPEGPFWDGVRNAGDHYDIIGGSICGSFVVFGGLSMVFYGPWRRQIARRHRVTEAVIGNGAAEGQEQGVEAVREDVDLIEYDAGLHMPHAKTARVGINSEGVGRAPS